ncbi:hypothetical protein ACFQ1L_28260 [Phytohabitans flavus]|uniref:hypothetical protein n=1 Tax=Phytohabitans flavus TaxID=1076124 RepID=UPI003634425A
MSDAPRYVVSTSTDATSVLRRLARGGWQTREGFALTEVAWDMAEARLVLFGRVPDAETAHLAVLAAARGTGIVAITDPAGDLGRALVADLGGSARCTRTRTPNPNRTATTWSAS